MTAEQTPDTQFATAEQFYKVLLRWMPEHVAALPEGKLVAGIFAQAWSDGSSWFFRPTYEPFQFWCQKTGLDVQSLWEEFQKHNRPYAKQRGLV